jgi:hypothetical protein
MPDEKIPEYFEQFMDVTSPSVEISDWIFLKQINYKFSRKTITVGYGTFRKLFTTVKSG